VSCSQVNSRIGRSCPDAQVSRLLAAARSKVQDWRTTLRKHVPVARQFVTKLLKDRLVFTPERRRGKLGVTFEGQGSIMPMLAGQVPEFQAVVHGLSSLAPASWNQIASWLKQIDDLRESA
jgi:hypothetical protein